MTLGHTYKMADLAMPSASVAFDDTHKMAVTSGGNAHKMADLAMHSTSVAFGHTHKMNTPSDSVAEILTFLNRAGWNINCSFAEGFDVASCWGRGRSEQ